MQETARSFHNLEWPAPGARLAGPVVWLRGWVVGKPGHDCIDLRVRHGGGTHLGVLGLPRTDLAAHFGSARPWLPAEFIIGVPVPDGPASLTVEVMDAHGGWHELQTLSLTVSSDGVPPPRIEGRLETHELGTWTVRDAHHPFHGHLDDPGPSPALAHGRAPVFGWLLDETGPIATVLATTDTLVFNHLEHSLTDEALAAKVPQHAGARHARLRGAADCPSTLVEPACLRVYSVSPEGAVTLCFAQRLVFTPPAPPEICNIIRYKFPPAAGLTYPAVVPRNLPELPSGRPRRMLLVVRSLLPNDATLRALDLARHLTASFRWAARVISAEDGPLRQDFEACEVESLVVNPGPLLAARDPAMMEQALQELQRQILWRHLDAVAVFDPVCGWAITLARRQNIPVLLDCVTDEPMEPDPTASAAVQALLRESWRAANALCFGSAAAARAQHAQLKDRPAAIIAQWHSPRLARAARPDEPRIALAPLRTADWLARHHPAIAAGWKFQQGPAGGMAAERLARQDDAFHGPAVVHSPDWSVDGLALCLGPLFGRGPLRPLLDATAAGVPVAAPRLPVTEEFFAGTRTPLVAEDNPLALAHLLVAFDAQPGLFRREAAGASELIRRRHAPAMLLPQWEALLAAVTAERG